MHEREGNPYTTSTAGKINEAVSQMVQTAIALASRTRKSDFGSSDCLYVGCMAALGAFQAVAPFTADRPELNEDQIKEIGMQETVKLINSDTLLLTALITSKMQKEIKVVDEGMGAAGVTTKYGPDIIYAAIQDWKKLTGKNPEGIFDKTMLKAAYEAAQQLNFDEFKTENFQPLPLSKATH